MTKDDVTVNSKANRDCLAKAKPDEPMFIILGRDPDGGNIVRLWAQRRFDAGDTEHAEQVFKIADAMDAWRAAGHRPESAPEPQAYAAMRAADPSTAEKLELAKEALEGIERIAEENTGVSGARSLQTAMHAIANGARTAIAKIDGSEQG
jgi:hypothetical protein